MFDFPRSEFSLLTSDNALIIVPIERKDGHVAIPISPTKLFVASKHRAFLHTVDQLVQRTPTKVARVVNRLTVERADELVIGSDDSQLNFVRARFGKDRLGTFGVEGTFEVAE